MKKFILGTLCGLMISVPTYAFANEIKTMIGKTVDGEFPVFIDGKRLDVDAIVIEGTSYAPIRALGEAVGKNVKFTGLEIILTTPENNQMSQKTEVPKQVFNPPISQEERLRALESQIDSTISQIEATKKAIDLKVGEKTGIDYAQQLKDLQKKLEELQRQKTELEKAP